jgi:hypothetical protein
LSLCGASTSAAKHDERFHFDLRAPRKSKSSGLEEERYEYGRDERDFMGTASDGAQTEADGHLEDWVSASADLRVLVRPTLVGTGVSRSSGYLF